MTTIEKVKTAIAAFESTQKKYREFGANDSEPDGVWQRLLMAAVSGLAPTPPRTSDGWELYTSSMDCKEAANALFDSALGAIHAIEACSISDVKILRDYLESYCWRCN